MLHLFLGVDAARAKIKAKSLADGELVVCGEGAHEFHEALSYLESQGLFSHTVTLLLDRPLESKEGRELIKEHGEALNASDTDVFVIETALSSEDKKLFPKSVPVTEFGKKVAEVRPLPFALTDFFMAGDRKRAWIEYQTLLRAGVSPEEIHGTLSWAVRSALLSGKATSPDEAGLKPFVYNKSRRSLEKLGVAYVEQLSRSLVSLYHRARAGEGDMALGIELLLLKK